jgi:hypothetical protein
LSLVFFYPPVSGFSVSSPKGRFLIFAGEPLIGAD